jgi:hypothetical protein
MGVGAAHNMWKLVQAVVYSRDVGRYVIYQSAIRQRCSSTSRQAKRLRVDRHDETAAKKDASRGGPIEKSDVDKASQLTAKSRGR